MRKQKKIEIGSRINEFEQLQSSQSILMYSLLLNGFKGESDSIRQNLIAHYLQPVIDEIAFCSAPISEDRSVEYFTDIHSYADIKFRDFTKKTVRTALPGSHTMEIEVNVTVQGILSDRLPSMDEASDIYMDNFASMLEICLANLDTFFNCEFSGYINYTFNVDNYSTVVSETKYVNSTFDKDVYSLSDDEIERFIIPASENALRNVLCGQTLEKLSQMFVDAFTKRPEQTLTDLAYSKERILWVLNSIQCYLEILLMKVYDLDKTRMNFIYDGVSSFLPEDIVNCYKYDGNIVVQVENKGNNLFKKSKLEDIINDTFEGVPVSISLGKSIKQEKQVCQPQMNETSQSLCMEH